MPLDDSQLNQLAARMLADYDAGTPGTIYDEGFRLELPEAWRLQTAVTGLREARGETVAGYKIGCVSKTNQELMGVSHPVWGRLWNSELHESGASLKKSGYANLAIEAEFGVTFARDLEPGLSIHEIVDEVDAVYPTLELHNLVMRGDPPHGHELIANNCINCGVVMGAPVTELARASETDLKLVYDGKIVDQWDTLGWPHDILGAVTALVSALGTHGLVLKAGELALTGAWGPPIPVGDHRQVDVLSSAFGNATASFV